MFCYFDHIYVTYGISLCVQQAAERTVLLIQ